MQVALEKNVLNWIINQCSGHLVNTRDLELLYAWRNEEKQPTFNQVDMISRHIGIPIGYFFLYNPPTEDMSLLEYRTVDSIDLEKPSRELMDTIHEMQIIQDWMKEELSHQGIEENTIIGSMRDEKNIDTIINYVRSLLGLNLDWYRDSRNVEDSFRILREKISNKGIVVMMNGVVGNNTHRALSVDEFRAFAIVDNVVPLIFINNKDSNNGKLFSLIHEFIHLILGESSFFNGIDSYKNSVKPIETICNKVTAELLVPNSLFCAMWRENLDNNLEDKISTLAKWFRCGHVVIARRALDNKFINQDQYKRYVSYAIQQFEITRKKGKGGDYYKTVVSRIDKGFFNYLVNSVATGRTLYTDAYRLTNTNRSTFNQLMIKMGGGLY